MEAMTGVKYVVEIEMNTDHDCWYDRSIFQPRVSRYFENYLYEYTVDADGYGDKCRRVFDTDEQAASFVLTFMDNIGRKGETNRYAKDIAEWMHERILDGIAEFWKDGYTYIDFENGNCEGYITISKVETDARPIKHIIYEGDDYELDE